MRRQTLLPLFALMALALSRTSRSLEYEVVYEWTSMPFYASEQEESEAIANGSYIKENCFMTGVKVYNGIVYATVPRWLPGVPFTLNVVVEIDPGNPILRPYPSEAMNEIDNCDALQTVQSMEIDPKTGFMWIIDVGRRNSQSSNPDDVVNNCPPKLVVWDIRTNSEVRRHVFPDEVLGWTTNYVNDIVVDPVDGMWAYMSDTGVNSQTGHNGGVIVYSVESNSSWRLEHPSMQPVPAAKPITILGIISVFDTPSDGIAVTPDGVDLFYTPLAAFDVFSIPTSVAKAGPASGNDLDPYVRRAGAKSSQTDGMTFGKDGNLYYGGLEDNAIFKWEAEADRQQQGVATLGETQLVTETELSRDDIELIWPDTFAWDGSYLYATTNRLSFAFANLTDFEEGGSAGQGPPAEGPHFRIVRIDVGDTSYLAE